MSEDDTFRILRRTPFEMLVYPLCTEVTLEDRKSMLEKHGWTIEEAIKEYHRRNPQ